MFDDEALGGTKPPSKTTEAPTDDDELSAELSRAAREAVRQPPDPRLEAQFARLLGGDAPAAAPAGRAAPAERAAPVERAQTERPAQPERPAPAEQELAALTAALSSLAARTADVERRLTLVTRLLGPVLVALVVLAVAVVARSIG